MTHGTIKQERGSALVAVLIIAFLVAAAFAAFSSWISVGSQTVVHSLNTQRAVYNAQTGYYAALDWLKTPFAASISTVPLNLNSLTDGATYFLTLQQSLTDPSLVNVTSVGYYESPRGHFIEPPPLGKPAEMGIIDAVVRKDSVKNYFAAVPGSLGVAYGTDLSYGSVYGKDLVFVTGTSSATTKIGAAYYLTSVSPSAQPGWVTFTQSPYNAQQLPNPPRLPQVSPMQSGYQTMASDPGGQCVLTGTGNPKTYTITGAWSPTYNPSNVCYCDGNLVLGDASGPVTITGLVVIFVKGSTSIGNSVTVNNPTSSPPTDWLAVASEGDITILNTVPHSMSLFGTYVTDGALTVQSGGGTPWNDGNLIFTGGVISQKFISLAAFQNSRIYSYEGANANLRLPFLVQPVSWTIRHGGSN